MQAISYLRHHLLVALPNMQDSYFDHTVTLMCQHDDEGAFGVSINRPLEVTVGELLLQLDLEVKDRAIAEKVALNGGPVQPEQGFVLHDTDRTWLSTLVVADNLAITSSKDILKDIAVGEGPDNFLLVLGCAAWGAGQLEEELKANTWLTCPADNHIVFDMPYPHRWRGAAMSIGVDVGLLSLAAGHA